MKKLRPWICISILLATVLTICLYGFAYLLVVPLPFLPKYNEPDRAIIKNIINNWENVNIYTPTEMPEKVEDIIKQPEIVVNTSEEEFYSLFSEIDRETLTTYLSENQADLGNGYGKLFIDKVDSANTPTGIKTIHGDDVLAIDAYDNIIIIGVTVGNTTGKLAILKDKMQLGMALVSDINYWAPIAELAKSEKAILAINASGANYNKANNYYTIHGLSKRNGEIIRKSSSIDNVIGFTADGDLQVGADANIDELYNAAEFGPILIADGNTINSYKENDSKMARTAIGQTSNGDVLMLVVDGDEADGKTGATLSELANVFKKYNAYNAGNLSGGSRSVMYWNGRIVNKAKGNNGKGMLLSNAFVVKTAIDFDDLNKSKQDTIKD